MVSLHSCAATKKMEEKNKCENPEKFHQTGKKASSRLNPYFVYRIMNAFTKLGKATLNDT